MIESYEISIWEFAGERHAYSRGASEGDVHVVAVATLPSNDGSYILFIAVGFA